MPLVQVVGEQVDQLWSVTMALTVAEIYLICRFFGGTDTAAFGYSSKTALFASLGCYVVSLVMGYMTRGMLVFMVSKADDAFEASKAFEHAHVVAGLQFVFMVLGVVLFIGLFAANPSKISAILKEM